MDKQLTRVLGEIKAGMAGWLPSLDPGLPLVVVSDRPRHASRIVRLSIGDPVAPAMRLIVKIAPDRLPPAAVVSRPRLVDVASPGERSTLELAALQAVEARLRALADPRFDAIRALGVVADGLALVMVQQRGTAVGSVLLRRPIGRPASVPDDRLVETAGAWLRWFHDDPSGATDRPARQDSVAGLVDAFDEFGQFVADATHDPSVIEIARVGGAAILDLPAPLPVRPVHGDFAARNLIIGSDGRLAVMDLLGRYRSPIYEDLATFLVGLRASRHAVASGNRLYRRSVEELEERFLAGYFGSERVPSDTLAAYELLLVLDKFASRLVAPHGRGVVGRIEWRLLERHFRARLRTLARRLETG